jgi:hypothetical protein
MLHELMAAAASHPFDDVSSEFDAGWTNRYRHHRRRYAAAAPAAVIVLHRHIGDRRPFGDELL